MTEDQHDCEVQGCAAWYAENFGDGASPPDFHYCPCLDGVHRDCWHFYQGCCCHWNDSYYSQADPCPPGGCFHTGGEVNVAQQEGIPQRLVYVLNHQDEFGVDYREY